MSDNSGQNDPSMEEILGSIRRIISEDNAQGGHGHHPDAVADEDDVLELTDEVGDDEAAASRREPIFGSRAAPATEESEADEGGARREPVLGIQRDEPAAGSDAESETQAGSEMTGDVGTAEPEWTGASEELVAAQDDSFGDETEPSADSLGAVEGDSLQGAGEAWDSEQTHDTGESPELSGSADYAAAAQEEEQPMSMQSDETAGDGSEDENRTTPTGEPILSETASSATTAALSELNRAMAEKSSKMKVGEGDVTIAEMVREMLRPMLREWIDENLPVIVERVVKREIQKLVDRTHDDD